MNIFFVSRRRTHVSVKFALSLFGGVFLSFRGIQKRIIRIDMSTLGPEIWYLVFQAVSFNMTVMFIVSLKPDRSAGYPT